MNTLKEMVNAIKQDYWCYASISKITFIKAYFVYPGFRVTIWYRVCRYVNSNSRYPRLLGKIFTLGLLRQQLKTGIQLNPGTEIGPGLYVPHFGNIVINPNSKIGRNCYLSHEVTLGKAHSGKRKGAPSLGDNVFVGPGVKILGKLHVGDNTAIGANSVVLSDLPGNVFAAGAPACVVRKSGTTTMLDRDV